MSKVAVFGAGSWGTAFSIVLADGGNDVTMWARREEVAAPGALRLSALVRVVRGSGTGLK